MEDLDVVLEAAFARAEDVKLAADPELLLRELLQPVRALFATQLALVHAQRGSSESIASDDVKSHTSELLGAESDDKKSHNLFNDAASKIQALVLRSSTVGSEGRPSTSGSSSSRVSSIRQSIVVPRMSKLGFDSSKMGRHSYLSGAANKLQALVKGNRNGAATTPPPPAAVAVVVKPKPSLDSHRSDAAVRIQALVRGKQGRVTAIKQHKFLEQGTKVLKKYVMKSDRFPNCHVLDTAHGFTAPNFRRLQDTPLYGSAQPSVRGIQTILDQVADDGFTKVVWINLREEAVIYVDGNPFTARRIAKLNENDLVEGISAHKIQVLETSMKHSLQEQLEKSNNTFLYWNEFTLGENDLVSSYVYPDRVMTLPEVYESTSVTMSNSLITSITYHRIPIERENAPEQTDVENIVELIKRAMEDNESGNAAGDTAFVFNCQMGKRRTTTALVLCSLLWQRVNITPASFPADLKPLSESDKPGKNGNFAVIREVQKHITFGPQDKWWVDKTIDEASSVCNLRDVISEYHDRSNAEAKPARRSYLLRHAMSFLERYYFLILFAEYLLTTHNPRLEENEDEPESASSSPPTFSKWLRQHPNLFRLLDDMGGVRYKSDKVLENSVIVMDHFFGIAKLPFNLTENVLNYRRISDKPIFGTAQCLEIGIRDVISSLQGEFDRAIWINLREEAVVYVSGRPFVVRHREKLLDNVEYPGIEVDEITAIEAQVKRETQAEVRKANGLFMYWYEPQENVSEENMEHISPDREIKTLVEVYENVAKSTEFDLRYARIPVSDETAPEEKDLDDMVRLIVPAFMNELGLNGTTSSAKTAVICNCQMGRGRTTTALVCVYMLRAVLEADALSGGSLEELLASGADSLNRRQSVAVAAEYVAIKNLVDTLENGSESKRLVDHAIDQCEHMQNLRECISECRDLAMDPKLAEDKRDSLMLRAVNYLERYFYLICFASYLLEERSSFFKRKLFVAWMNDRYGSALYELLDNLCFEEELGAETHASSMRWRWRRKRKLVSRLE